MDSLLIFVIGMLVGMIIWEAVWQWVLRLERKEKDDHEI